MWKSEWESRKGNRKGYSWGQVQSHPPERTAFRPGPRTDLLLKEIRMGTGTDQVQFVSFGATNCIKLIENHLGKGSYVNVNVQVALAPGLPVAAAPPDKG